MSTSKSPLGLPPRRFQEPVDTFAKRPARAMPGSKPPPGDGTSAYDVKPLTLKAGMRLFRRAVLGMLHGVALHELDGFCAMLKGDLRAMLDAAQKRADEQRKEP